MAKKTTTRRAASKSPSKAGAKAASTTTRAAARPATKTTTKARFVKAKHVPGGASAGAGPAKASGGMAAGNSTRSDFRQPGSVAIERMPEPYLSIARAADAMIRAAVPGVESVVKWGNACYYRDGLAFASLCQTRAGVNLALPGTKLDDPDGLLEGTGKTMRHVKLMDAADARRPAVARLVKQAVKFGIERM